MMPREVTPTHFPNLAATLIADCTVVALTPATNDVAWAASATWSAARAVARAGRRVGPHRRYSSFPVMTQRVRASPGPRFSQV